MADLPAAVDPNNMGLNITPYDDDNTAAAGTTTLRHIDMSTRLAWSTFGSVQSDPYRWGHATLPGYTPPAGRPTTPAPPERVEPEPRTALDSPQTIAQSARNGVPISGRVPGAGQPRHHGQQRGARRPARSTIDIDAAGPGTLARVPVRRREGLHAGVQLELRPGDQPGAGLRALGLRADRRRDPAVVAGHERARGRRRPSGRSPPATRSISLPVTRGGRAEDRERRVRARGLPDAAGRGAGVRRADLLGLRPGRDRRRHRAGDALADARHAGGVRAVHARHREGLLRDHHRHGHLDRR